MNVVQEFSRFANLYDTYNIIQSQVAKKLVSLIENKYYNQVIDIGCGSGVVYKKMIEDEIIFDRFIAVDFSQEMLNIHPTLPKIEKKCLDFNSHKSFKLLQNNKYDLLVSSSALQWSVNLDMTLRELSLIAKEYCFSFFTANTFATLHKVAGVKSPIYRVDSIKSVINKYYNFSFEIVNYRLSFDNVLEMFQYIKKSGVSGGEKQLSYKQIKEVIKEYPLDYLEFEVLFIRAKRKS